MAIQGRKIPKRTWDRFLEIFREKATSISGACKMLDLSPHSVYNQCARDPRFAEQLDIIRDTIRRPFAEDILFTKVVQGDLGAIKFYLNGRGGKRWNEYKILPSIIKDEVLEEMRRSKLNKQRVPTQEEMIGVQALMEAQEAASVKEIPDTITVIIDTRSIKNSGHPRGGGIIEEECEDD